MATFTPGTVVPITGAAFGIGRAIALRRAVVVSAAATHLPRACQAAATIKAAGGQAIVPHAGVSRETPFLDGDPAHHFGPARVHRSRWQGQLPG
jgi:NAD(P)-dependent dehydrogenase (short-subunit alcohol dehydrogenase family)